MSIPSDQHPTDEDNEYYRRLRSNLGEGGSEVPGFIPLKHELLQLVKYWVEEDLRGQWWRFTTGWIGRFESNISALACARIGEIKALIGTNEVTKAVEEAQERFKAEQDERLWEIFVNGDMDQWMAVQEEHDRIIRKIYYSDRHPDERD